MRWTSVISGLVVLTSAAPAQAAPHANACVRVTAKDVDARVHVKPVSLKRSLLYDGRRLLVGRARVGTPGPKEEWRIERDAAVSPATGVRLRLRPASGCRRFPDAALNVRGRSARGTLRGFADAHVHVTAAQRAGGLALSGEPFARYGIPEALGSDAEVHGPTGSLDLTGNLLAGRDAEAPHDTDGWPTFSGWPAHDANTHQQIYHRWLQRAWRGGLRLAVAQTVEDEPLCRLEPRTSHSCDETETVELGARTLRRLQDYVDAQAGGRGRGWFRLVEGPREAARVIRGGRLAVVIGAESSNVLGCSQRQGVAGCDRARVDAGIRRLRRAGVRSVFVAHWVDNALGGAALEGGAKGAFIDLMQQSFTGAPFATGACPRAGQGEETDAGPGRVCNVRGLTPLGAYAVRRLMDAGMLIEVDHLSEAARARVLELAARRDYPLVSSHTNTGGTWTPPELRSLAAHGGFATAVAGDPREITERTRALSGYRGLEVGLSTDTGGFKTLPGPTRGLKYPFRSPLGDDVTFARQRTGQRTFRLARDGMAHYGLLPDVLARARSVRGGPKALERLRGSAAAYLRTWRRTGARG